MTKFSVWVFLSLAFVMVLSNACRPGLPTTPPPPPTFAPAPIGRLAEGGKVTMANICSKCHGDRGQGGIGPAIIGANATLQKFETAKGLFDYVRIAMPLEAPGSLTQQQYLEVMSFLILQNGFADAGRTINPNGLEELLLKK
ncbi:MAG: hypothetical protein HYX81_05535 [Chloroflexi bacterium]|nr:hypothetical protein [Chloroflexota bacterium]